MAASELGIDHKRFFEFFLALQLAPIDAMREGQMLARLNLLGLI